MPETQTEADAVVVEEALDQIRRASAIGRNGAQAEEPSIVDRLLEADWCTGNDLAAALARLEETDQSAAVFFQLPYPIRLPRRWIDVTQPGKPASAICFRLHAREGNILEDREDAPLMSEARHDFSGHERFCNAYIPADPTGRLLRTQAIVVFQLWGWRAEAFPTYSRLAAQREGRHSPLPYRNGYLKTDGGKPVTVSGYESLLASRLYDEARWLLAQLLPRYAVACRDSTAFTPRTLDCFFSLLSNGRLVPSGTGVSSVALAARALPTAPTEQNLVAFLERLGGSVPSIYEDYLLQSFAHIERGQFGLAVVHSVMILEWFLGEIIQDRMVRPTTQILAGQDGLRSLIVEKLWPEEGRHPSITEKLDRYLPALGFQFVRGQKEALHRVLTLRNTITHSNPTNAAVIQVDARNAVVTVLSFVRSLMDQLSAGELTRGT